LLVGFFGFCWCFGFDCLFDRCAFGHTFGNDAQLRNRRIGASRVGIVALLAFPHAHALSSYTRKTARWATVAFPQLGDYFGVAFTYCGSVADAQSTRGAHFLGSSQSLFTSLVACAVAWPCPWLVLPLLILVSVQSSPCHLSEWRRC
jgi:hypothetical protein